MKHNLSICHAAFGFLSSTLKNSVLAFLLSSCAYINAAAAGSIIEIDPQQQLADGSIVFNINIVNGTQLPAIVKVEITSRAGAAFTTVLNGITYMANISADGKSVTLDFGDAGLLPDSFDGSQGNKMENPGAYGFEATVRYSDGTSMTGMLVNMGDSDDGDLDLWRFDSEKTGSGGPRNARRVLFEGGFESGAILVPEEWANVETSYSDFREQAKAVSYEARSGYYAAELQIEQSDPDWKGSGNYRAEITPIPPNPMPSSSHTDNVGISHDSPEGITRWYGFSTFFPADWQNEPDIDFIVLAQWYSKKDDDAGGTDVRTNSPVVSIEVTGDSKYRIHNRWDDAPYTDSPGGFPNHQKWTLGPIVKGKWVDWVFRIHWAYDTTGQLEVWQNGIKVVDVKDRGICYNDNNGIKFKAGLYSGPEYHQFPKTVLLDDVRIGDEFASFSDVAPGDATQPPFPSDPENAAPVVDAGSDVTVAFPNEAFLSGSVSDDGLPISPGAVSVKWSAISGPGEVTFSNANAADTTVNFSVPGTYVLQLTADDGELIASDNLTIISSDTSCTTGMPTVNLAPSSQSAKAGDMLSYSVSVTNTDSSNCGTSSFTLSEALPSGWAGGLSPSTLSLAPGETGTATLSVTSADSATASTYNVTVNVADASESTHTATDGASYTVLEACASATPILSLSPGSQSGDPGTTLAYTVTLTNTDNLACAASTFDLTITYLPGGWGGDLSPTHLTLSPGATGSSTLLVTSADTAAAGSYSPQVAVSDSLEPEHAKTATSSYVVNDTKTTEDIEAPSIPTGLAASSNFKEVKLSWAASVDNVGVIGYEVWRDGVMIGDTADTSYSDNSLADNVMYEYAVDAYDAAGNRSGKSNSLSAGKAKAKAKAKGQGGGKGKGQNK